MMRTLPQLMKYRALCAMRLFAHAWPTMRSPAVATNH